MSKSVKHYKSTHKKPCFLVGNQKNVKKITNKHIKCFCLFSSKKSPRKCQKVTKKSPKFEDFLQHGKPCILRGKSTNDIGVGTHFCVILDLSYGEKSDTFLCKNVCFFSCKTIFYFLNGMCFCTGICDLKTLYFL